MARDYSSRRNNPPDKNGKRKSSKRPTPAARPVRAKKKSAPKKTSSGGNGGRSAPSIRAGAPGCIWLLCGLFLGIAGFSAYYIASRPAGHGPESMSFELPNAHIEADSAAQTIDPDKTNVAANSEAEKQPRFSFYRMLPNYKIEVPAGEQTRQTATDTHAPHEAEPAANTPAPNAAANAKDSRSEHRQSADSSHQSGAGFLIQAGAFSTERDADRRKARLALLGVTANIVGIRSSSGKTIYRVQSSTFKSSDKADSLARRLQSHGIETIVRQAR